MTVHRSSMSSLQLAALASAALILLPLGYITALALSADPAVWQSLGDSLRLAWLTEVPVEFSRAAVASFAADRLSRLVPPLDTVLGAEPPEPAADRRRAEWDAYRRWLDEHLRSGIP